MKVVDQLANLAPFAWVFCIRMEVTAVGDVVASLGVIISRVGQCVAGLARPSDSIRIR